MPSSVRLTCSTEQPGRLGNNEMRDIDSFLGKLEMFVEGYFSHYTTFSCTEDDGFIRIFRAQQYGGGEISVR